MDEIFQDRSYTTKVFDAGNGERVAKIHAGHIHYKDSEGFFQDSVISFEDKGTYWSMTKHNYRLYVAKDFGAEQLIRFDNKYEGANHTIYYEPHSIVWYNPELDDVVTFRAQQSVTGQLIGNNVIRYENAFGTGIDFEITLQRSGFKKEVVIKNKPAQLPEPPGEGYTMYALFKYTGTGLQVKDSEGITWDQSSFFGGLKNFEIVETINPAAKSLIIKAYGVDSDVLFPKRVNLNVRWFLRNGVLWQAKEIPLEKLTLATFPVRFDTTTNYYSGAGDGRIYSNATEAWANARDTTNVTANYTDNTSTAGEARIYLVGTSYYIGRGYIQIDTSALSGASISSATVNFYIG